jgi:hypothetical protein
MTVSKVRCDELRVAADLYSIKHWRFKFNAVSKAKQSSSLHYSSFGSPSGAGAPKALGWQMYRSVACNRHSEIWGGHMFAITAGKRDSLDLKSGIDPMAFGIQPLMDSSSIRPMAEFFCRASVGCATAIAAMSSGG